MLHFRIALIGTILASWSVAQDKTLAELLIGLADESTIRTDAASSLSARTRDPKAATDCQVGSRSAKCYIAEDTIRPDRFMPAFQKNYGGTLEIDRRKWSKSDRFMIIQINSQHTSWLPISNVDSGDLAAAEIRGLARSGELFGCWEHHCSVVISARSKEAELFARCSTVEIDGVKAFPKGCNPIMFQKGGEIWLEAVTEYVFHGINPGAPPMSESITLSAAKALGITEEILIRAADAALTKEPFNFEKRSIRGGYNSLLAVANPRPSKVLAGGWFEWPTVAINPSGLTLYIDCDLLINKYNTTRPEDWRQPSQGQQAAYCNALVANISNAVEAVCSKYGTVKRQGTNRLECLATAPK